MGSFARVGRSVELAIDTSGFHFFDKTTGLNTKSSAGIE
jgi:hypothetical protein